MPRHSPYRIVLSPREREALESRARQYTLPYFQVVRARMILLASEGRANDEISTIQGPGLWAAARLRPSIALDFAKTEPRLVGMEFRRQLPDATEPNDTF